MGVVAIPPDPTGGGHLSVKIELNEAELQKTVDLLKNALRKLQGNPQLAAQLGALTLQDSSATAAGRNGQPTAAAAAATGQLAPVAIASGQTAPAQHAMAQPPSRTMPVPSQAAAIQQQQQQQQQQAPVPFPTPTQTSNAPQQQRHAAASMPTAQQQQWQQPAAGYIHPQQPQPQQQWQQQQTVPSQPQWQQPPAPVARPPPPQQQQYGAPQQQQWQQQQQQAAPQASYQQLQQQQAMPRPTPLPQQQQQAPPPPPLRQAAAPPAAPGSKGMPPRQAAWRCIHHSDPLDHNSDAVQALAYCPQIDDLPGGDGHAGWLISSSRKMLNLWECNAGGGPGMPSVMLMHSQETDFISSSLAMEPELKLMFAGSADVKAAPGQMPDCITVHSLSAERGMLAYKYRMVLPDPLAPKPGQPPPPKQLRKPIGTKVVSLHQLGRSLRGCCAATCGPRLLVYETHVGMTASTNISRPRHEWTAAPVPITSLHAAAISGLLFSGAADGTVAVWNARDRLGQQQAVRMLRHPQAAPITGIQLVSEHMLASAGAGSGVLLWDLRSPNSPLQTVIPDSSAVLNLKISPVGDCLAVVTGKGLYSVDLREGCGALSLIAEAGGSTPQGRPGVAAAAAARPPLDIEWNWNTGELYACGYGGAISVYRH